MPPTCLIPIRISHRPSPIFSLIHISVFSSSPALNELGSLNSCTPIFPGSSYATPPLEVKNRCLSTTPGSLNQSECCFFLLKVVEISSKGEFVN
ncbi:hypothetical protein R6Q59_029420 [Mikania micrantha]